MTLQKRHLRIVCWAILMVSFGLLITQVTPTSAAPGARKLSSRDDLPVSWPIKIASDSNLENFLGLLITVRTEVFARVIQPDYLDKLFTARLLRNGEPETVSSEVKLVASRATPASYWITIGWENSGKLEKAAFHIWEETESLARAVEVYHSVGSYPPFALIFPSATLVDALPTSETNEEWKINDSELSLSFKRDPDLALQEAMTHIVSSVPADSRYPQTRCSSCHMGYDDWDATLVRYNSLVVDLLGDQTKIPFSEISYHWRDLGATLGSKLFLQGAKGSVRILLPKPGETHATLPQELSYRVTELDWDTSQHTIVKGSGAFSLTISQETKSK